MSVKFIVLSFISVVMCLSAVANPLGTTMSKKSSCSRMVSLH